MGRGRPHIELQDSKFTMKIHSLIITLATFILLLQFTGIQTATYDELKLGMFVIKKDYKTTNGKPGEVIKKKKWTTSTKGRYVYSVTVKWLGGWTSNVYNLDNLLILPVYKSSPNNC